MVRKGFISEEELINEWIVLSRFQVQDQCYSEDEKRISVGYINAIVVPISRLEYLKECELPKEN